ncbi:phospholipase D/nuclease [Pleurotus eryngii]|uniref:Phospholipase D/nuclease n=1 Tax=Pleurotus eryngii TaxID=5323 RepID=A0A9P5ZQS0_PLEER|nr:phospholipase D/nuclease [Pleurotus eryngii]
MSEDDDFARAIALSLQEQGAASKPIVVESDDEDGDQVDDDQRFERDLKRALEASKAESSRRPEVVEVSPEPSATPPVVQGGSAMPAFLSERAQMEKERRERQMKRRREAGLDVEDELKKQRERTESDDSDGGMEPPTKSSNAGSSSTQELPLIDQTFWDGEVRPTMNQFASKTDTRKKFTLTEKGDLSFAIIASYVASVAWIYEFFDPSVPVIFVTQPDPSGNAGIKNILPHWIKTVPFLKNGYGCMHMKFMLLFYKTGRLRVMISTANLIDYDYRDIENALWIQDIPRLPTPRKSKKMAYPDDFPAVFTRVLKALNVPPALSTFLKTDHPNLPLQSLDDLCTHWDWSKVNVLLVPSIAGKHEGWPQVIRTGHPRLMMAVRKLGLSKRSSGMTLECQGSSIGHYTTQWMNEFYLSATGQSTEKWLDQTKRKREALSYPPIKIIFPSLKTVRATVMGERGGGTMFCSRKSWEAPNFPRKLFHDSNSKAGGVLMHTKMIIGLVKPASQSSHASSSSPQKQTNRREENDFGSVEEESDDEVRIVQGHKEAIGWAYVGSHNFTPSAWGTLSGSSFTPVLNIKNYELGIVFPLKDEAEVEKVACWQRPPRTYVPGDDRPWMQQESEYFQQHE